jgi:hypothetical protein
MTKDRHSSIVLLDQFRPVFKSITCRRSFGSGIGGHLEFNGVGSNRQCKGGSDRDSQNLCKITYIHLDLFVLFAGSRMLHESDKAPKRNNQDLPSGA